MLIRRRGDDERGVIVVIVALLMVVILLFVAFVVDFGAAHSERRQDQTAADAAVLAGAQQLAQGVPAAGSAAMTIARQNLKQTYSDADWSALWASCSDPERDANQYPISYAGPPATACISFAEGYTRMRVRLPDQVIQASFGRVAGVDKLLAHASAEAEVEPPAGGGLLPFGVVNFGSEPGNQVCNTLAGQCGGGSSDTLRLLDSPLVGNPQFGSTVDCRNVDFQQRAEFNTAMGLDHLVVIKKSTDAQRADDCGIQLPNTVYATSAQGNSGLQTTFIAGQALGLITGPGSGTKYPDGKPARLRRFPASVSGWVGKTRTVGGAPADNRPLWDFIPDTLHAPNIPAPCDRAVVSSKITMQICLDAYAVGGPYTPLFTARSPETPVGLYDIQLSPRFGFVPSFNGCCPDGAVNALGPISAFHLIFLQTMYLASNEGAPWDPGEGGTSALTISHFDGASGLKIQDSMVPASVLATGPNGSLRGSKVSLIK